MNSLNIWDKYNDVEIKNNEVTDGVFAILRDESDTDRAVYEILQYLGNYFDVDCILVKELIEGGLVERCTYEWSRDGKTLKLGNEIRFIMQTAPEMIRSFRERRDGVYLYTGADGGARTLLTRHSGVTRFLQIPSYHSGNFIGSVDFIDYRHTGEWDRESIITIKSACRILTGFISNNRELFQAEDDALNLNNLDPITGLPRYESFMDRVREGIKTSDNSPVAIVCCDITNFKFINEKYGYEIGDRLLRLLAEQAYRTFDRMISCCREYSDHFLMAIKFPEGTGEETVRMQVDALGRGFANEAKKLIKDVRLVVNAGISYSREGLTELADSLTRADVARKYGKNSRSSNDYYSVLFAPHMLIDTQKAVDLIAQMKPALENGEFKVYFQPKVTCDTLEIVGAEALIRWQKPDGHFVFPDEFIPAFERDGCIVDIDFFVYEECFRKIYMSYSSGESVVPVSMNVSRVHLYSTRFVEKIDGLRRKYPLPPEMIEFEVTEGIYLENLPQALSTLETLHSWGFKVSMDDFGSGYSSLEMLTKLPIDVLKLDRVFMKEHLEESDKILVRCLIDMAHKLGIKVLCEGVENEEQRQFLAEAGCQAMQGYYFSRPIDDEAFIVMLRKNYEEHGKIK